MAEKIATIHHHTDLVSGKSLRAFSRSPTNSFQGALRVIKDVEDDQVPEAVAKAFRDHFKSEAQTFLDAAKPLWKDAYAADTRRRQAESR